MCGMHDRGLPHCGGAGAENVKRPSLDRVEQLCVTHNGTCVQPCDGCDLAAEVTALLRLLRIATESEPVLDRIAALASECEALRVQLRHDQTDAEQYAHYANERIAELKSVLARTEIPPPADPYECIHDHPHTLVVTCTSVYPSRSELCERNELCAICAGSVILLLQQLTERTEPV